VPGGGFLVIGEGSVAIGAGGMVQSCFLEKAGGTEVLQCGLSCIAGLEKICIFQGLFSQAYMERNY
jgi:hypothetical protein